MIEVAEKYFNHIDQLQYTTFSKIRQIIDIPSGESINDTRKELSKEASVLLNEIRNNLKIIEIKLQGNHLKLTKTKYQAYQQKFLGLKAKLRESQMKSSENEDELVHRKRVDKYVKSVLEKLERNKSSKDLREDLFAGRSENDQKAGNDNTVKDQILIHNKSITNSLQLTRQLMSTSVMQTELNIDSIDQQSKDLSQLNNKLLDLNVVLKRSRQIVRFIEKQDKKDKQRIYLSIGFLLLCCAWVIWRRILKLPVKIMLWGFFKVFGIVNWFSVKTSGNQKIEVYASVREALEVTPISMNFDNEFIQDIGTEKDDETTTWDDILQETAQRIINEESAQNMVTGNNLQETEGRFVDEL